MSFTIEALFLDADVAPIFLTYQKKYSWKHCPGEDGRGADAYHATDLCPRLLLCEQFDRSRMVEERCYGYLAINR